MHVFVTHSSIPSIMACIALKFLARELKEALNNHNNDPHCDLSVPDEIKSTRLWSGRVKYENFA